MIFIFINYLIFPISLSPALSLSFTNMSSKSSLTLKKVKKVVKPDVTENIDQIVRKIEQVHQFQSSNQNRYKAITDSLIDKSGETLLNLFWNKFGSAQTIIDAYSDAYDQCIRFVESYTVEVVTSNNIKYYLNFKDVAIEPSMITSGISGDRKTEKNYPRNVRGRDDKSYTAQMTCRVMVTDSSGFEIRDEKATRQLIVNMPIALNSRQCNLSNSEVKIEELGEDQFDSFGYFIIHGVSKVLIMYERSMSNVYLCRMTGPSKEHQGRKSAMAKKAKAETQKRYICEMATQPLDQPWVFKSRLTLSYFGQKKSDMQVYVNLSSFSSDGKKAAVVPLFLIFAMMSAVPPNKFKGTRTSVQPDNPLGMMDLILDHCNNVDYVLIREALIPTFNEYKLYEEEYPWVAYASKSGVTHPDLDKNLTDDERHDELTKYYFNQLNSSLFSHFPYIFDSNDDIIFQDALLRRQKLLGLLVCRLLQTALGLRVEDDRDHYAFKYLQTGGNLLFLNFVHYFKDLISKMQKGLGNYTNLTPSHIKFESEKITEDMLKAIKNGMTPTIGRQTNVGKSSLSQMVNPISLAAKHTMVNVIKIPSGDNSRITKPKEIDFSSFGRTCGAQTPEGANCGLTKSRSIGSIITTYINEMEFIGKIAQFWRIERDDKNMETSPFLLNGKFMGYCNALKTKAALLKLRRSGHLHYSIEIVHNYDDEIQISSSNGRLIRPCVIVYTDEDGKQYTKLQEITASTMIKTFDDLLNDGVIEFISAMEEHYSKNILIAVNENQLNVPIDGDIDRIENPESYISNILTILSLMTSSKTLQYSMTVDVSWMRDANVNSVIINGMTNPISISHASSSGISHASSTLGYSSIELMPFLKEALKTPYSKSQFSIEQKGNSIIISEKEKLTSHVPMYSHLEYHPNLILGIVTATIPYIERMPGPRTVYQTSMGRAAYGIPDLRVFDDMHGVAKRLQYAQRPLVTTSVSTLLGGNQRPAGQNVMLAIGAFGFNMEDSLVINQASIQMGLFAYGESHGLHITSKGDETYGIPKNHKNNNKYRNIDPSTGIIRVGSVVEGGDPLVAKFKTPSNNAEEDKPIETTIFAKKKEFGVVDKIIQNPDGMINIRIKHFMKDHQKFDELKFNTVLKWFSTINVQSEKEKAKESEKEKAKIKKDSAEMSHLLFAKKFALRFEHHIKKLFVPRFTQPSIYNTASADDQRKLSNILVMIQVVLLENWDKNRDYTYNDITFSINPARYQMYIDAIKSNEVSISQKIELIQGEISMLNEMENDTRGKLITLMMAHRNGVDTSNMSLIKSMLEKGGVITSGMSDATVLEYAKNPPRSFNQTIENRLKMLKNTLSDLMDDSASRDYSDSRGNDTSEASGASEDISEYKARMISTRSIPILELGDKLASRYAQKGTIGAIIPKEDMPVIRRYMLINGEMVEDLLIPDVIINPNAFPSRMTVGQLVEMVTGLIASQTGQFGDATAFKNLKVESLGETLEQLGWKATGKYPAYNGKTGETIQCEIFSGPVYYQLLNHFVHSKSSVRASTGGINALTGQPTEGRAKGGGIRFGEMEQAATLAHRGVNLLQQQLAGSDLVDAIVCTNCHTLCPAFNAYSGICEACDKQVSVTQIRKPTIVATQYMAGMGITTEFKFKNTTSDRAKASAASITHSS